MEYVFLALLVALMIVALTSGFPVAFSLPGSAILAIGLAALAGYLFVGDIDAYFVVDGPSEWINAGVTNYRSLYWTVERDTLIAIPLFVFMGIMLQRSKIAEDLLVTMAKLFGPIPGGLGISVVFVGALLAATTGIVGATVIAMGLISLPAMLRNRYSPSLACGAICASGTLGQIIPPSIVLIILADQLSSAADQASAARQQDYRESTGEFTMPSELDIVSASAGDMFMGALAPGLILVGLYMAYILVVALINPKSAPPVHRDAAFDRAFAVRVLLTLAPPLTLIFVVLGSIISDVATVNQAGAIGAVGAMIMGSYRLAEGRARAYWPALLAVASLLELAVVTQVFHINVRLIETQHDVLGLILALIGAAGLVTAALWAAIRAYRIDDTLSGVMLETAKTTSMVFIILIGAAMLTSAFRGFGGEALVKDYLTGLPGGFWTQFLVVMLVIFLLGFFLDFIEIAVVVVPIVAPILLADPEANITAVWFGVMVGLNIQTSFLTPPFGFALFYLRGVAPKVVKTLAIYKGAVAFIALQLVGLTIAGMYPSLVNYLPARISLTGETAPPPINPKLQACLQDYVFDYYDANETALRQAARTARGIDLAILPTHDRQQLRDSFDAVEATFERVAAVRAATAALTAFNPEYKPLHAEVRRIKRELRRLERRLAALNTERSRLSRQFNPDNHRLGELDQAIIAARDERQALERRIPEQWETQRQHYRTLRDQETQAIRRYRQTVDGAYAPLPVLAQTIAQAERLAALTAQIEALRRVVETQAGQASTAAIKAVERAVGELEGADNITSALAKARRALKNAEQPKRDQARRHYETALAQWGAEIRWRSQAAQSVLPGLQAYQAALRGSIGLRLQPRLTDDQADYVAACQSTHKDLSLYF